jgi:hypothetical protein
MPFLTRTASGNGFPKNSRVYAVASPAPIDEEVVQKIVAMIRHIASRTNEAITAAQLLPKVLQAADANTITAIADRIAQPNGFSKADAKKIYDAGVATERKRAQKEYSGRMFQSVDGEEPSWFDIASLCRANPQVFWGDHEKEFVEKMCRRTVHGGEPTVREGNWLRKIYARVR